MVPASPAYTDFQVLADLVGGDRAAQLQMAGLAQSYCAEQEAKLAAAVRSGLHALASDLAHSLRGTLLMIGAGPAVAIVADMEVLLKAGNSARAGLDLAPFEDAMAQVHADLRRFLAEAAPDSARAPAPVRPGR